MRIWAAVISTLMHVGVIVATVVVFPHAIRPQVELPPVLPPTILEIAEHTNIAPATPKPAEEPKPEPPKQKPVKPEPVPEPPKPKPEPKVEPPAPKPEPEPEPEPKAEPPKPVEPAPVEPAPDAKQADPKEHADVVPVPRPQRKKPPKPKAEEPKKPPVKKEEENVLDQFAALIDRTPRETDKERVFHEDKNNSAPTEQNPQTRAAAGLQTGLTLSEMDALRTQIGQCWTVLAGAKNAEDLIVILRVHFNPDGTVVGGRPPEVVNSWAANTNKFLKAAADGAIRAVLKCQPYELPADRYEAWRVVELEFDPRFALGQ